MFNLHSLPYLKWPHCRYRMCKGWMPKLGVCIEILCPKPIAFCTHLTQSHPTVRGLCVLFFWQSGELPVKPRLRFCNQSRRHQPTCPKNLLCCSCSPSLCSIHPLICSRSSAWKSANITAQHKKVQKQIPATTDQSDFSQSSARLWNPSSLQTLNPSSSPMASFLIINLVSDQVTLPWMWVRV